MSDVTRILSQIDSGDPRAAEQLLPLVYEELRKLAAAKLANEKPGLTLQATALVHEAYLRMIGERGSQPVWDSPGHFFAAAAEAMRRILIERARRVVQDRRGGAWARIELGDGLAARSVKPDELLVVDEALSRLEQEAAEVAQLFKLCYFCGHSVEEAAEILGISRATGYRYWNFSRAWLLRHLRS
jgi:RNA polymerase sigma factor (TIGR02999 family)